jgi:outer membrane protein
MKHRLINTALMTTVACAGFAHAESLPLWELGAGAAVLSFPDYRGSDKQRGYLLPLPYVVYRGDVLKVDRESVRGLLFKTDRVELDLSINGSVPVRSGNPARQGMPDLDPTLELGPSLNVLLAQDPQCYKLTLKLPVRAVIASDFHHTHNAGVLANPQLDVDVQMAQGWKLGLVAGALFGDRRYHDYFYSVAPQYAVAGRPAYDAPGGYSGTQFIVSMSKRFDQFWVGAFIKADNVSHAAFETSPLVEKHSNLSVGFGISWIFAQSTERVDASE